MSYQEATYRCECGHVATVERITSHEFHAHCAKCSRVVVLSWFHDAPAPAWEGDRSPRLPLRAADHEGAQ